MDRFVEHDRRIQALEEAMRLLLSLPSVAVEVAEAQGLTPAQAKQAQAEMVQAVQAAQAARAARAEGGAAPAGAAPAGAAPAGQAAAGPAPAGAAPWEQLYPAIRAQARQAAVDLCTQALGRTLEPRRAQVATEQRRLTLLDPRLTTLRDTLHAQRHQAPNLLDPIISTVASLKTAVARFREVLNQLPARRFEALLPEPDLPPPPPAWEIANAYTPAPGTVGRLNLAQAIQAWEASVNEALDQYQSACLEQVAATAADLDQLLGRGPALQLQDQVLSIYTMLYHAQSSDPALAPALDPLEPEARALLESLGFTVILPQVGRNFDVYLQDFLDYDPTSEYPADTVSKVIEPGFKKDGKPLVKAKVLISGKRV